ncbi:ABC-2 type transport system ATP-binding protein [Paenibacillus algorifonticola]|uniref:ABC-2 type transport system ATP-binding protein n=1 Tax=Paenibacillus algorifonticola TaxID=684063 RepID=A0A1I2G2Q5_9BACL|nr:ABC transporter ATP-binding protein [Paenibacillus algorifonticola]SFF11419.1 ABC-2 type transport system ATP-binding protein [Paenibacillus algorifonticola]
MNDIIKLNNVSKQYKLFSIEPLSCTFKQGYITGLIGPNGAGKTTLIKMIMGITRPGTGEITIFGQSQSLQEAEIKQQIGFVSDECHYYEHLSIQSMKNIIAPFYKKWDDNAFSRLLDRFELSPKMKIRSLSKGMKMKLGLAFALSHHADLLIMDEPTAGLDPVFRRELLDLLAEIMLDERKSIVFSTHITTDLDRIADYIAFLHHGRLVFNESKEQIQERYVLVKGPLSLLEAPSVNAVFIGVRESLVGFEGLTDRGHEIAAIVGTSAQLSRPTLEDIMYFTARGGKSHAAAIT